MYRVGACCIVVFLLPLFAHADVFINEIAWAGTDISANDEWIELYNSGTEAVDLSGWLIQASDGSPAISLEGEIAGGGFFLLERTDDETVPAVNADQIYTGALSNSGELLRLYDVDGLIVHTVDGSGGWSIGGDAASRATLQRTSGGWVTAAGTPNSTNAGGDDSSNDDSEDDSGDDTPADDDEEDSSVDDGDSDLPDDDPVDTDVVSQSSDDPKEKRHLRDVEITKNRITVLAGSPVTLSAESFDQHNDRLWNVSYIWNVGDGEILEGDTVVHEWKHSGTYVVATTAWKGNEELVVKFNVVVREAAISISDYKIGSDGYIEIKNDTTKEVNLSQWSIQSGSNIRLIPHNTFVSAGSSVRLYAEGLGFTPVDKPILRYPGGKVVAEVKRSISDQVASVLNAPLIQVADAATEEKNKEIQENKENKNVFVPETEPQNSSMLWWIVALVGLIGIGAIAVVLLTRQSQEDPFDTV